MDSNDKDPTLDVIKGAGFATIGEITERGDVMLDVVSGAGDDGLVVTISISAEFGPERRELGIHLLNVDEVCALITILQEAAQISRDPDGNGRVRGVRDVPP